tara:strand:+ start:537 stop:842 length:306 start_codon:yes stop_codon:yes gene_type:complete
MNPKFSLDFISDWRHGWLIVTEEHLALLYFLPSDFSEYSFFRSGDDGTAFALEEDDDARLFIERAVEHGIMLDVTDIEVEGYSPIWACQDGWTRMSSLEVQ